MKSKVKKRYTIYFILFNCIVFGLSLLLIKLYFSKVNLDNLVDLEYQYNVITLSATMGGFLFTGLSILISVIDKDNIKPYWEANYLDILNKSAIVGIIIFVIVVLMSLIAILFDETRESTFFIKTQLCFIILGISNFAYSIKELIFVIKTLKE